MKLETLFLKVAVVLFGIPIIGLCIFVFPEIVEFFVELNPTLDFLQYPFLIGLYVTAIVFFFALYQTFILLGYIDKNQAFSELSVKALKNIKNCAFSIGALYVVFMPLIYLMAEVDDAPGMILIGIAIIFCCMVVAIFGDVLQKLVSKVANSKA